MKKQLFIMLAALAFANVGGAESELISADITNPESVIELAAEENQKYYNDQNVYADSVGFTVKFQDFEVSSGISQVDMVLKNYQGDVTGTYNVETENIWNFSETLEAVRELAKTETPTEEQLAAVSTGCLSGQLTGLPDGFYTLAVSVTDKAGNRSADSEVQFIKDSREPVITIENRLSFCAERTEDNLYTGGSWIVTVEEMTPTTEFSKMLCGIEADVTSWKERRNEKTGENIRTVELAFGAGESCEEGRYQFQVVAADALERQSKADSGEFVIDHAAPTYEIVCSEADRLADQSEEGILYYNKDMTAEIKIAEETDYSDALIELGVINSAGEAVILWKNGSGSTANEYFCLKHEPETNEFYLTVKASEKSEDAGYRFYISGKDKAGNRLVPAAEEEEKEIHTIRVMDVTSPVLNTVTYSTEEGFCSFGNRDYVNAQTEMTFSITEQYPAAGSAFITSEGQMDCSWEEKTAGEYVTSLMVPMFGAAGDEQTIRLGIIDKAGNKAVLGTKLRSVTNTIFTDGVFTDKFTVDTVAPQIRLEYENILPARKNVDGIDYFKEQVSAKIIVEDHNFEESLFNVKVTGSSGKAVFKESSWKSAGDVHIKTVTFDKDGQYTISVEGADCAQNQLKLQKTEHTAASGDNDGKAVLKLAVDQKAPVIQIMPGAAAGKTADGQVLYNDDAVYTVVVSDRQENNYASGTKTTSFTAAAEDGRWAVCTAEWKQKPVCDAGIAVTKLKETENQTVFRVKISRESFNVNHIVLSVTAEDISGNLSKAEAEPVGIDITAPKMTVAYDGQKASNGKYFRNIRKAEITVYERNFTEECVSLLVNGKMQQLQFSKDDAVSGNADRTAWKAEYMFDAEDDYVVEAECTDLAGNVGSTEYVGEAPREFTIDMTAPEIKVTFENQNAVNDNYYAEKQTAVITITEDHFSPDNVKIFGEAFCAGETVSYPQTGEWISEGNVHKTSIVYEADALYTLDAECMDLAENPSADIPEERFTVDTTAPELIITGVENKGSYPGKVRPQISFIDNNYADCEMSLTYTDRNGEKKDITESVVGMVRAAVDESGRGSKSILLKDIEPLEENDGIYTLAVKVFDKAGHMTEKSVTYSVNRFGSVYLYSPDLTAVIGGYYQKMAGDLYIGVYNANRLLEDSVKLEITCDGAALKNQNSRADTKAAMQYNQGGWYEYRFVLDHRDFAKDGLYAISISGKDEAGNVKTNADQPISFYVDTSAPVLERVIGMEEPIVNAAEQSVQYAVSDVIGLKKISVYINEKQIECIEEFSDENLYEGSFAVGTGIRQKVRIVAEDKAGNVMDTQAGDFTAGYLFHPEITVSTDFFVRWYANTALFWSSVTAACAVVGGLTVIFIKKKENFIKP